MANPNMGQVYDAAQAGIADPRTPGLGSAVNAWGAAQFWLNAGSATLWQHVNTYVSLIPGSVNP